MQKVKKFSGWNQQSLEDDINRWLKEEDAVVTAISTNQKGDYVYVWVVYDQPPKMDVTWRT